MGVDRSDYIIYGWKLSYEMKHANGETIDFWDDKYLSMIEGRPGELFTIIRDGMMGAHVVFGIMIQKADEYEGWKFVELNFHEYNSQRPEVIEKYIEIFGKEPDNDPTILIFSHFS